MFDCVHENAVKIIFLCLVPFKILTNVNWNSQIPLIRNTTIKRKLKLAKKHPDLGEKQICKKKKKKKTLASQQIQHHSQSHWTINTPQRHQTTTSNTTKTCSVVRHHPKPKSGSKNKEKKRTNKQNHKKARLSITGNCFLLYYSVILYICIACFNFYNCIIRLWALLIFSLLKYGLAI